MAPSHVPVLLCLAADALSALASVRCGLQPDLLSGGLAEVLVGLCREANNRRWRTGNGRRESQCREGLSGHKPLQFIEQRPRDAARCGEVLRVLVECGNFMFQFGGQ